MRNAGTWWMIALLMFLLDLYVFQAVKTVANHQSDKARMMISVVYWIVSALTLAALLLFPYVQALQTSVIFRNYVFAILVGLFLAKLIGSLFFLSDDIRRFFYWIYLTIAPNKSVATDSEGGGIPRSVFMSWLGLGIGGTLFGSLLYGFGNKYKYRLQKIPLAFPHLPASFKGLKIIHISDIHSGSFNDIAAVSKGVDMILQQKPDLILFTGDLVNDRATEMKPYMHVFNRLKAPLGVYSSLGNHDYGDYVQWPTEQAKIDNLDKLKSIHASMGWRLMMNEHIVLERGNDKIALVGIENWGAKANFPKYGDMKKAFAGLREKNIPFKILLSHDPSHWHAQVIPEYKDVQLTLSGHTHGMQFGVDSKYFKWSPVQYMYNEWAGLYTVGEQNLYVNRGFGFLGYPGRLGILPEITVFELG